MDMEKNCLSCLSGLPFLGIPLLESPLLEPTWLGDLGEFGDLEWTEICNGETDNGYSLKLTVQAPGALLMLFQSS
jgi:hypothetical protein